MTVQEFIEKNNNDANQIISQFGKIIYYLRPFGVILKGVLTGLAQKENYPIFSVNHLLYAEHIFETEEEGKTFVQNTQKRENKRRNL